VLRLKIKKEFFGEVLRLYFFVDRPGPAIFSDSRERENFENFLGDSEAKRCGIFLSEASLIFGFFASSLTSH